MRVLKWGTAWQFDCPASVVEALDLKAGNEIGIRVLGDRTSDPGQTFPV